MMQTSQSLSPSDQLAVERFRLQATKMSLIVGTILLLIAFICFLSRIPPLKENASGIGEFTSVVVLCLVTYAYRTFSEFLTAVADYREFRTRNPS